TVLPLTVLRSSAPESDARRAACAAPSTRTPSAESQVLTAYTTAPISDDQARDRFIWRSNTGVPARLTLSLRRISLRFNIIVRFGSFADIEVCIINVCFALKSRHSPSRFLCPLRGRSGHLNETTKSQQCAVYRVFRLVTCIDPPSRGDRRSTTHAGTGAQASSGAVVG